LGWFYLSTILDDYSRYIIAWKLCTSIKVEDVTDTLDLAIAASGCDQVRVEHRPRLLSDNGPCYVASDLSDWLEKYKINQVHGAPGHPQTQGKIERWHQTPADVYFSKGSAILLERKRIKQETLRERRLNHHAKAAQIKPQTEPKSPFLKSQKSLNLYDTDSQ
jgi:putative transposase